MSLKIRHHIYKYESKKKSRGKQLNILNLVTMEAQQKLESYKAALSETIFSFIYLY